MSDFDLFGAPDIIDKAAIKTAAEASYQLFTSYCEAGFSEKEALYLLGYVMTHPVQKEGEGK